VLSGRGLCDKLITLPEGSYRLWCVVCDLENLKNEEAMTRVGSVGGTSPGITQLGHEAEHLRPANVAWVSSSKATHPPPLGLS